MNYRVRAKGAAYEITDATGKYVATAEDQATAHTIATVLRGDAGAEIAKLNTLVAEMSWRDMRMSLALRILRAFALNNIDFPETASIKAYFRDWIDAAGTQGGWPPIGWPTGLPLLERELARLGFQNVEGMVGLKLPDDVKETVQ